jgi:hypothetical protein
VLPSLTIERMLIEEPTSAKVSIEQELPKRTTERRLKLEPNVTLSRVDNMLPQRVALLKDNEDPRHK